jgi:hypothetical protein
VKGDFQVEEMIGYVCHNPTWMVFFNGTESGWSNTQTLAISTSLPLTDQTALAVGIFVAIIAVIAFRFLVYFKKRKREVKPSGQPLGNQSG